MRLFLFCSIGIGLFWSIWNQAADEPKDLASELPRIPPKSVEEAQKSFRLTDGFHLELVAHEPNVIDPVDAAFDEFGRMYVAEMRDYPFSAEPRPQCPDGRGKEGAGVIRLLVDENEDGVFEKSTVFADKIEWPTSVVCYRGGVFVLAPPHLYYFKDHDGDGVAEQREIVLSGFSRANVQGLANNLKWGLDNRIHGSAGLNGGDLSHEGTPLGTISGGAILEFDPSTEQLTLSSGGAQFGYSFDDWGHEFVCSNSVHIQQVVFPHRYLLRNPYLPVPGVTRTIAKEGGAAPVFRASRPEPWRLVRTKRRAADPELSKRLPQSELVPIGFFTSATGVTIYRGDAYPESFRGTVFIGDVGGNLVHHKILNQDGVGLLASRSIPDAEFLTSTDNWFRPTNFVNAPDGTLYILDMYRETIEHPFSIPEDIKAHLDLESGDDRGRIYRLVYKDWKRPVTPKLGNLTSSELVPYLASGNSYLRETAQRLIWERQDFLVTSAISDLIRNTKSPVGRIHGMWALQGLGPAPGKLPPELIEIGLSNPHPQVRRHAIRLSEKLVDENKELLKSWEKLVQDENPEVLLQLAFSLGESKSSGSARLLAKFLRSHAQNADLRTAALSSSRGKEGALFQEIWGDEEFRKTPPGRALLTTISSITGASGDVVRIGEILDSATRDRKTGFGDKSEILDSLGSALSKTGGALSELLKDAAISSRTRGAVEEFFRTTMSTASDLTVEEKTRASAVRLLGFSPLPETESLLKELLDPRQPASIQLASVEGLGRRGEGSLAILLEAWDQLAPLVRAKVVETMLMLPGGVNKLLNQIGEGKIRPGELEKDRKQLLLNYPQDDIRELARKVLGGETNRDRAMILEKYQTTLELAGDLESGEKLFTKQCSVCHRIGELGHAVGPDLASVLSKSDADLLVNILDPNREALPSFVLYVVETSDGQSYSGIIASESATSVTLRRAEAQESTVLRTTIEAMKSTGQSLMPEGFEKDLSPQQIADILAYIRKAAPKKKSE